MRMVGVEQHGKTAWRLAALRLESVLLPGLLPGRRQMRGHRRQARATTAASVRLAGSQAGFPQRLAPHLTSPRQKTGERNALAAPC
jgi:hypothetical protein